MRQLIETVVLGLIASIVGAAPGWASMVGVVVAGGDDVIVRRESGQVQPVEGFRSLAVGDTLTVGEQGAQVLLFDDSRAQLLPATTYRVGRSGLFATIGEGCVVSHEYATEWRAGVSVGGAADRETPGITAVVAQRAGVLTAGQGWRVPAPGELIEPNDVVRVDDGGALRLEYPDGGVVHLTGPCQGYVTASGIELEFGRTLVDARQGKGVTVGTPTGFVERGRAVFGAAVADDTTYVRCYDGRLQVRNRVGRRRSTENLTELTQAMVDESGRVRRTRRLLRGEDAKRVTGAVIAAIERADSPEYVQHIASATAMLGQILSRKQNGESGPTAAPAPAPTPAPASAAAPSPTPVQEPSQAVEPVQTAASDQLPQQAMAQVREASNRGEAMVFAQSRDSSPAQPREQIQYAQAGRNDDSPDIGSGIVDFSFGKL